VNRLPAFALAVLATAVVTAAPSLAAKKPAGPQQNVSAAAGSSTTLVLSQVPGSYHIAVSGKAPPSTPLVLTLLGTLSSDIPDILVNRRTVVTDRAGNFNVEVAPAGDYFREGLMTVVAASPSGAILARSQIVLTVPNAGLSVPNEAHLKTES
jgi:hypothetical protein